MVWHDHPEYAAEDLLTHEVKAHERQESGLADFKLLKKLWPYLKPYKKQLVTAFVLLPVIALAEIAQTFAIRNAIDGPLRHGDLMQLGLYAGGFALFMAINYRARYVQMEVSQATGQMIIKDLRGDLYRHFQTLSPRFYQKHPLGKLVTRLTSDIENLSEMLSSGGLAMLADVAMILGAAIGMFILNWKLALVATVSMTLLIASMEFFRNRARHAYDEIRVKMARLNGFLQENFAGMELVQLYRREPRNYAHFESLNASNMQSGIHSIFYSTSFNALVDYTTILTMVMILWLGGHGVQDGSMTIGSLVGFFLFVRKMFEPIEEISEKYTILQSGLSSIDKVMALFQESPELPPPLPNPEANYPRSRGEIKYENVGFAYLADHPVLKNINLHIQPGETIALVGPSGAGKTTLLKLLLRFYDVTSGKILLDEKPLTEWDLGALRHNIVSIQQDDFLFSRTIAENIALAPYDANDTAMAEALEHAVRRSKAQAVLDRLPEGFATVLEERGKNLSAGEKQLILFARAMYHDPAVLVLDEATSAIDPMTEQWVQEAMTELMQGRTVLIVAHRLSTIRKASRILVISHGEIVEAGSHDELMRNPDSLYRQYYQYQELLSQTAPV